MHLGNEQFTLSFETGSEPGKQIASIKIVVDGKTLQALEPGGKAVEDFRFTTVQDPKSGVDKLGLEFKPTKARKSTFELTPVLKNGKESPKTYKLAILVRE
jgi:hypothetical protein